MDEIESKTLKCYTKYDTLQLHGYHYIVLLKYIIN